MRHLCQGMFIQINGAPYVFKKEPTNDFKTVKYMNEVKKKQHIMEFPSFQFNAINHEMASASTRF